MQCGPGAKNTNADNLTKFSVEIVQQLEFTTCSNSSQISTNVTVKALNTSVKTAPSRTNSPSGGPNVTPGSHTNVPTQPSGTSASTAGLIGQDVACKQEPSSQDCPEFVDLEQCAAALEKDAAANGGSSFPGFSDLIGDDTSDAIITSDAFKDLISEISDFPSEFMKEFDFDGDTKSNIPTSDDLSSHQPPPPPPINQNRTPTGSIYGGTSAPGVVGQGLPELRPAAQTLKQMAEQHQHKTQLGLNYPAHARNPNQTAQSAVTPPQPQTPNIKQEVIIFSYFLFFIRISLPVKLLLLT